MKPTWNSTIPATSSPTALKATIVDIMPEESNATNPRMIATASTHNKLANNIVVRNRYSECTSCGCRRTDMNDRNLFSCVEFSWKRRAPPVLGTESAVVGITGFEPATPSSRTKCATKLRHIPSKSNASRQTTLVPNPASQRGKSALLTGGKTAALVQT